MSSIFSYIGRSLFFIGSGHLIFNGLRLTGDPAASTTLQFALFQNSGYNNGVIYTAGLSVPSQPTVAAGAAGKNTGSYSVRLSAIRSQTGAESNASIQSAPVTLTAQKMAVTFPAAVGNGHDKWGVYVTAANFGSVGPHLSLPSTLTGESPIGYVTETSVVAGGRTLSFTWYDGDIVGGDLAPIDNFVPPAGTHAFALEGCMAVAGCYGGVDAVSTTNPGNMIAVSKAGFPEAFPVDINHLLALPEPPTLVLTRAAGGYVYIAGKNSLSVVRYTGAVSKAPLGLSVLWPDVGFAYQTNACLADGVLYGYSATKGIVRIDGDGNPDYRFGAAVVRQFESVSASTVAVGYDPSTNLVVYGYTSGGVSRLICYNKSWDVWSTPIEFETLVSVPAGGPATIKSMYTNAGQLYIILDTGGTDYGIYQFNSGTGSTWKLRSAWRDGGAPEVNKTITSVKSATSDNSTNPETIKIRKNLNDTVVASKSFATVGAAKHFTVYRTNVRDAKTYSIEQTGNDDDTLALELVVDGIASQINT
jgi:hypothetical protein